MFHLSLSSSLPAACPGKFTCNTGRCIDKTMRCDGWVDCTDASDERSCSKSFLWILFAGACDGMDASKWEETPGLLRSLPSVQIGLMHQGWELKAVLGSPAGLEVSQTGVSLIICAS